MKPGHRTTEFILTLLVCIGAIAAALVGVLPPRYATVASAVSVAAYSISRGITKNGKTAL